MKIGYPCINLSIDCSSGRGFRLKSYSEARLTAAVDNNLACLQRILEFNKAHHILFFRITSDLVPFASHPVCRFDWQHHYAEQFSAIGDTIRSGGMRVTMHPDQFILINSPRSDVFERSVEELRYHCDVLDLMGMDATCKVQIHAGGAYGDKDASIRRFAERYRGLEAQITKRLVVENDERIFNVADCLTVHELTGVPLVFDTFHHELFNTGEGVAEALARTAATWRTEDGLPIVDYSDQDPDGRRGKHAGSFHPERLQAFLGKTAAIDFDLMLEVKDKERSAIEAMRLAKDDRRLILH